MELSEGNNGSIEEWKDLFVKEQFFNTCGKDLRTFLMERNPKRCSELIELAEHYIEAHGENNALSKRTLDKKPRVCVDVDEELDGAQGAQLC
ncbi:hypothetical protein ElyMa_003746100 [Elysia marginata]|uniref:RGS domain-containing protein n=1 Tax=Elysia marginata TaxID=1093978 RepID=A0AAV4F812_9GAST|nr:hypothetical protein ElyMa_003746100 [Elysia marginata]